MNTNLKKLALAIGALVMVGGAWAAGEDTSSIGVTASIAAACSVGDSTGTINLGPLEMITALGTTSNAVSVSFNTFPAICTNGTTEPKFTYSSTNYDSGWFLKGVTDNTHLIAYTLHQDQTGTSDAVAANIATVYPSFEANGVSQALKLAAKILPEAKNGKLVQSYSDTITITSSFGVAD